MREDEDDWSTVPRKEETVYEWGDALRRGILVERLPHSSTLCPSPAGDYKKDGYEFSSYNAREDQRTSKL